MKKTMLTLLSLLLCAALCACAAVTTEPGPVVSGTAGSGTGTQPAAGAYSLRAAGDYAEILKQLSAAAQNGAMTDGGIVGPRLNAAADTGTKTTTAAGATTEAVAQAPQSTATTPESNPTDYSGTNVQVAGIDEGDVVKTDGKYLYVMDQNGGVRILLADGAQTRLVGSIPGTDDGGYNSELYVDGDTLVLLRTTYDNSVEDKDSTRTAAQLYDLGDRTAPVLRATLAQDGVYMTSRLLDGRLYLVSSLYVWYYAADGGVTPADDCYIPCVYNGKTEQTIAAGNIWLPPESDNQNYTVLTSIDLASGARLSEQAVLGSAGTVYMNAQNLYLAASEYGQTESAPRTVDQYSVVDYVGGSTTTITRFSVADGKLTLAATGSVPGSLLNQFSLDEQDGSLRLVTTIDQSSWSEYTDAKYGFTNYQDGDSLSSSALYVLDASLKTIGSVTDLAPGERVYSVRFAGSIGYFVTYKQVDPLFAVDLSDPTAPKVLSALKIPGFSQYLHVYGDGLLLGLGQNTTGADGTVPDGLKLSMFSTADPKNVTEITSLALGGSWSEAQYNHKAILVLPEKNIIAFPMDDGYVVYGYADGVFTQRATMALGDGMWFDATRGVQIGELFYVCTSNGVGVYSLSDFSRLATVTF